MNNISKLSGTINTKVEVNHTTEDNGKQFTDKYGRVYTYTLNGLIY